MQAQTAEGKAECVEQAVERVRATLDWSSELDFLSPSQMHHWDHLVCNTPAQREHQLKANTVNSTSKN